MWKSCFVSKRQQHINHKFNSTYIFQGQQLTDNKNDTRYLMKTTMPLTATGRQATTSIHDDHDDDNNNYNDDCQYCPSPQSDPLGRVLVVSGGQCGLPTVWTWRDVPRDSALLVSCCCGQPIVHTCI